MKHAHQPVGSSWRAVTVALLMGWVSQHPAGGFAPYVSISPKMTGKFSLETLLLSQELPKGPREARMYLRAEADDGAETEGKVEVGSKEYLDGFLSSPIQDDSVAERGSGLEQALKLGGGVAAILVALFLGFMASNGLL